MSSWSTTTKSEIVLSIFLEKIAIEKPEFIKVFWHHFFFSMFTESQPAEEPNYWIVRNFGCCTEWTFVINAGCHDKNEQKKTKVTELILRLNKLDLAKIRKIINRFHHNPLHPLFPDLLESRG